MKGPPPSWAYPGDEPLIVKAEDDGGAMHLVGASNAYAASALVDLFAAPDWYPDEHPAMPAIVAHGRKPAVQACAYCHLASGNGRLESSSLAGLSRAYIASAVRDMKSGKRRSAVPGRAPTDLMISLALAATDEEVNAAATYYSALVPTSRCEVIETDTAPRTVARGWVLEKDSAGGTEPLGNRVIEVPEDEGDFALRDDRARSTAYVPIGSVRRGEKLVTLGGPGKTTPCASCHGADLRGTLLAPRLAGLSPTYVVRQIYDFKSGARGGANANQMQAVTGNLGDEDIVDVAAYLSRLRPRP